MHKDRVKEYGQYDGGSRDDGAGCRVKGAFILAVIWLFVNGS